MRIYLAGPLFSEAERAWMKTIQQRILSQALDPDSTVQVIWPYELLSNDDIAALGNRAGQEIFARCKSELESADVLVACLDGTQVDDGTAWEIGYFFRHREGNAHRSIIGIRTDARNAGETKTSVVNAMIENSCDLIVSSVEDLIRALQGDNAVIK